MEILRGDPCFELLAFPTNWYLTRFCYFSKTSGKLKSIDFAVSKLWANLRGSWSTLDWSTGLDGTRIFSKEGNPRRIIERPLLDLFQTSNAFVNFPCVFSFRRKIELELIFSHERPGITSCRELEAAKFDRYVNLENREIRPYSHGEVDRRTGRHRATFRSRGVCSGLVDPMRRVDRRPPLSV